MPSSFTRSRRAAIPLGQHVTMKKTAAAQSAFVRSWFLPPTDDPSHSHSPHPHSHDHPLKKHHPSHILAQIPPPSSSLSSSTLASSLAQCDQLHRPPAPHAFHLGHDSSHCANFMDVVVDDSAMILFVDVNSSMYPPQMRPKLTRHLKSTAGIMDDFYLSWRSPHVMEEASPASQHLIYGAQANPYSTLQRHTVPAYLFLDATWRSKYPDNNPDKPTPYGTTGTTTVEMIYAGRLGYVSHDASSALIKDGCGLLFHLKLLDLDREVDLTLPATRELIAYLKTAADTQ